MAGSKSNQLETDFLTWALSGAAVTRPSSWYLGLFTDAAGLVNDQPTTEATTATCPGYARQQITSWTIAGNQAQNAAAASFTASGAWTVRYWGLFDASTGGRMLYWGDIPADSQSLASGNKLDFPINSVTINED